VRARKRGTVAYSLSLEALSRLPACLSPEKKNEKPRRQDKKSQKKRQQGNLAISTAPKIAKRNSRLKLIF
jgi:hypothetical protein